MRRLKVNPALRVLWRNGRTLLVLPGRPLKVLHGEGGLGVLADFATPRAEHEVVEEYEDAEQAKQAIATLFRVGALVLDGSWSAMPPDMVHAEDLFIDVQGQVQAITMGTAVINYALFKATEYVSKNGIEGAIVESGVWRGGSAMLCALTLVALGDTDRDIFLYDSFDGTWPKPGPEDGTIYDDAARSVAKAEEPNRVPTSEELKRYGLDADSIRTRLAETGYPLDRIHLVQGRVQDTVPGQLPVQIALLRLDTDYFASTYHELRHFYPRLVPGGILLVDDYPTEKGATRAVEQYFSETGQRIFLSRIDVQGRIGVKQ